MPMTTFLTKTENLYLSLDTEYKEAQAKHVLTGLTPTALVSFIIIRLTCEFEECLHNIVLDKLKRETNSEKMHNFLNTHIKLRSPKRTILKKELQSVNLTIPDIGILFPSEKHRFYYDRIFGTDKDESGTKNIRNQIAHMSDLNFTILPQWEEMVDYISVCDTVLQNIMDNLHFA